MKIFSVYDSKVACYYPPFIMKSHGEAIRSFIELVKDQRTNVYKYPEDFTLMEIGTWDETTGQVQSLLTPISHGKALEFHPNNNQTSIVAQEGVVR